MKFFAPLILALGCSPSTLIDVSIGVVGQGTVSVDEQSCGQSCLLKLAPGSRLEAHPSTGWEFAGWLGLCTGVGTSCSVEKPGSVVANFTDTASHLDIEVVGMGVVEIPAIGQSCSRTCSYEAPTGVVDLVATPGPGWRFQGFEGSCVGKACSLRSGLVLARFIPEPRIDIEFKGTGSGLVRDSLGRFECRTSCSAEFASSIIDVLPDAMTSGFVLSGACSNLPCTLTAPASLTIEFTKGRLVRVEVAGPGVVSGPQGLSCPGRCEGLVDPATPFSILASPRGPLSSFRGWDGGCNEIDGGMCNFGPSNADIDLFARFDSEVVFSRHFPFLRSPGSTDGARIRRSADGRLYLTWYSTNRGVSVDGQALGANSIISTGVVAMEADGGIRWTNVFGETPDGGLLQITPVYLRQAGARLVVGGQCVVARPNFCTPNLDYAMELDAEDGGVVAVRSLVAPNPLYEDLSPLPFISKSGELWSFESGIATATSQSTLPAMLSSCEPGTEQPVCLISWETSGTWQGCVLDSPLGGVLGRNAGLVRWDPRTSTCSLQATFRSTASQSSRIRPIVIGSGLVAMYAEDVTLDATTSTAGRSIVIGERTDGGFSWLVSPLPANESGFADSRGISTSFLLPGTGGPFTLFGTPFRRIQPYNAIFMSFGSGPTRRRALHFEGAWHLFGHSLDGVTSLAVTGENVTLDGEPLVPDGGAQIHILSFRD